MNEKIENIFQTNNWTCKCKYVKIFSLYLRYGWQPRGNFLASLGGPCAATLTYTVHLVKPGNLTYVYQFSDKDIIFDFEVGIPVPS